MDKIVVKQAVFELIDSLPTLASQRLQAHPHQQRASDVVALDTGFATLAILKPRQLLGFSVKLLNLPAQRTRFLSTLRRILRQVISHDPFRAVGGHLNSEQFHFEISWEPSDLDQSACRQLRLAPTQLLNASVWLCSPTVVYQSVGFERAVENLTHSGDLHHHLFSSVPGVHQHRLQRELSVLSHREHLLYMIQLALAVAVRVEDTVVNHPKLLRLRIDIHACNQSYASDHAVLVAAPLTAYHLNVGSEAMVQHRIIEDPVGVGVKCQLRLHLLPQQPGGEFFTTQVAVDGIMAKALQMVSHVRKRIVNLTTQQKLAVIEFAKVHVFSLPS